MTRDELRRLEIAAEMAGLSGADVSEWFGDGYGVTRGNPSLGVERLDPKKLNVWRVTKWQRANPAKKAATQARYYRRDGVKARQLALARARRAARPAPVLKCRECGACFTKRGRRGGTVPRFCRDACRQRSNYQQRTPGAKRITRRAAR